MNIQLNKASILGVMLIFCGSLFAQVSTHTVKKKETLYGISKKYGVTVEDLKTWNGLRGNTIKIGQELKVGDNIPTRGKDLSTYEVAMLGLDRDKMSVDEAAQKLSLLADLQREEAKKNSPYEKKEIISEDPMGLGIENSSLLRGQNPENMIYYRVKSGDDLFSIADNFEVSVDNLQSWNDIQGVRAGDVIIVQKSYPAEERRVPLPTGVSRSQDLSRVAVQPAWYEPVEVSRFNPDPGTSTFSPSTRSSFASFSFDEVQGGEIIYSRNMGGSNTEVVNRQPTRGGGDSFPPNLQPETPVVVLPNPAPTQVRESGNYGVFNIPGYTHFRFYGAHKILPVGSKVRIDLPNNPGHIEVTIVQQLPSHSPYVIALSPAVVNLLKSSGSNAQVSIMY